MGEEIFIDSSVKPLVSVLGRTYVRVMGFTAWTTDQLEQRLLANREQQSRLHAENLALLEEIDYRQVATGDGCRSLSEWVAGRLDVSLNTAKSLVRTMRRTQDRPDLREALDSGVSLDRVEAVSKIEDKVGLLEHLDVAGVEKEAALRTRITDEAEQRSSDDQFLVLQPSLDESWWKGWFGLEGTGGAILDMVISEMADTLPALPDGTRGSTAWRKATALIQLAVSDDPPPAQVTIHVDAKHAAETAGEAGVILEAGPRVGRAALQALLCESTLEVTARQEDGIPMIYGRRTRIIPPALRRAILERDGYTCVADGCDSDHRLQIHHKIPWSQGGTTDPDNLITLCWFHHQIVVHQRGFTPYPHPHHGRIRFRHTTPHRQTEIYTTGPDP
jgi:5-methylcytosine-specific restriction endonuclease McrA